MQFKNMRFVLRADRISDLLSMIRIEDIKQELKGIRT